MLPQASRTVPSCQTVMDSRYLVSRRWMLERRVRNEATKPNDNEITYYPVEAVLMLVSMMPSRPPIW